MKNKEVKKNMNKKLEDMFENCFKVLESCTEEDVKKMQELYDREIGRYSDVTLNPEFEIEYPAIFFYDGEGMKECGR